MVLTLAIHIARRWARAALAALALAAALPATAASTYVFATFKGDAAADEKALGLRLQQPHRLQPGVQHRLRWAHRRAARPQPLENIR